MQPIPFSVLLFHLFKSQEDIPKFVKVLWAIGFTFGFSSAALNIMIVYPRSFDSYWGISVVWLALTLNGIEHWLFALEYYFSSLDITNKLTLKPLATRGPTYLSKYFIAASCLYSIVQIVCCVG